MTITAILPCRKGSERVPQKNVRQFVSSGESLLTLKLAQLSHLDFVDEILLSTNDDEVVEQAQSLGMLKLRIDSRPEKLCQSDTNLQDLISYLGANVAPGEFLWTHATSPFVGPQLYRDAFSAFTSGRDAGFDSLVAVEKYQDFFLFQGKPVNFGLDGNFWPRTQDLRSLFRITSGLFIGSSDLLEKSRNRIGARPLLFELTGEAALDVDWPDDFEKASAAFASSGLSAQGEGA